MLVLILFLLPKVYTEAQAIYIGKKDMPFVTYDEIPVYVIIEGVQNFYVDVIYTDNDMLYININELFKALQIACKIESNGTVLTGFIERENNLYELNFNTGLIKIGNRTITSKEGLFMEEGGYYMESKLFSDVFRIAVAFNYRSLSLVLKPSFELPIIKQQRLEKMRNNISKIKGEIIADSIVGRNYNMFKLGTFDWAIASTQTVQGPTYNRINVGLGSELLFGEVNLNVNYYDRYDFDNRQLNYYWRWVDNENNYIKQAQFGRIYSNTISSINWPIVGGSIRNTPNTVRRASGFHTITDITEPNWTVELYINNSLIDYTVADASGMFVFNVPIVYGYTTLKLKFYGPLGEERTEERSIIMPYSFLPANEFEFGLYSGVVLDSSLSKFGRTEVNYGLSSAITIGGGYEYLSSIPTDPHIPFANITLQPLKKLIVSGEYANGVRTKANMNYHLMRGSILELDYTKYVDGQKARRTNAPEERKVRLSVPFRLGRIVGFAKIDYTQLVFKEFTYSQSNAAFTAHYRRFSLNNASQINWIKEREPYFMNETGLGYKMKKGVNLRLNTRYNMNEGRFVNVKAELEKKFAKAYISASYERYFLYNQNYIGVNFRYDLFFARTGFSAHHYNKNFITAQSFNGSLAFDAPNKYVHLTNNSSLGKGGILLYPFIDINNNGLYDANEPLVSLERIKINGGKPIINKSDTLIRIPDLNAFSYYFIELSDADLDNIAWRFKDKTYKVMVDPNQFKRVDIPIEVLGEVNGYVYLQNGYKKGLGRMTVSFFRKEGDQHVAQTLSEHDGYINFLGLGPGDYIARLDTQQLNMLNLTAEPFEIAFSIQQDLYGDIVDGINFTLKIKDKSIINNIIKPVIENEDTEPLLEGKEINEENKNEELNKNVIFDELSQPDVNTFQNSIKDSVNVEYYKKTNEYINELNEYYEKLNTYFDLLIKTLEKNMDAIENKQNEK